MHCHGKGTVWTARPAELNGKGEKRDDENYSWAGQTTAGNGRRNHIDQHISQAESGKAERQGNRNLCRNRKESDGFIGTAFWR